MKIVINGNEITDFSSFVDAIAARFKGEESSYFGFDLHSFGDCLHGGYLGSPPYDIVIENSSRLVAVMDHKGLARYCEDMLRIIDTGGRGLVQEDARNWYEHMRLNAEQGVGPTLLDLILEVVDEAPASLTLRNLPEH